MLHGHRYALEATFAANELDDLGRVIDFGVIREVLGSWVDDNLDHNTILCEKDKNLGEKIFSETNQKIYYMKENPTAENIANHIFKEICPKLFANKNVKCTAIKLYETPNCYTNVK
jgi:6-pyruvoyltetrahydropterin/6-carboxytetrahydropterin synthase